MSALQPVSKGVSGSHGLAAGAAGPPAIQGRERLLDFAAQHLARLPRALALLLALAWMAAIWDLSSGPVELGYKLPLGELLNNLAHGPLYGILAALWCMVLPRRPVSNPGIARWPELTPSRAAWALCWTLAYGVIDEWHQAAVPGRSGCWSDLLTDLTGAGLAIACVRVLGQQSSKRRAALPQLLGWALAVLLAAGIATWGPDLPIA